MAQKFHKFRASSLDEAYNRMRETLGDQAVVLRTTQVRDEGLLGLLKPKLVELTASAPTPKVRPARRKLSPVENKYAAASAVGSDERVTETVAYFKKLVSDAQRRMGGPRAVALPPRQEGNTAVAPVIPFRKPEAVTNDEVRRELREIRDTLQVLVAETPGAALPTEFAPHYRRLVGQGVSRKVAAGLVGAVVKGCDLMVLRDARVFAERLGIEIRKRVQVTGGIGLRGGLCRVVALVGATGVGKTTTVAKLAARFAVREHARVALITSDTYRIAAPEQLRVYATIIGLPTEVVNDPKEMAAALRAFRAYDLVLIDTAGGSQFNIRQIRELKDLLDVAHPNEVMLVLSANTQLEELRSVVANFRSLKPTSFLFCKLDETKRYGAMFSLIAQERLPLSYFSVGQNVPDDLVLAEPGMVANLVLKGRDNRGRSSTASS